MESRSVPLTRGSAMVCGTGPTELTSLRRGVSDTVVKYTEWDDMSRDEMWFQSLGEKDYWGYTYLHKLCNAPKEGQDDPGWDEVRLFNGLLSAEIRQMAVTSKQNGWTPLHLACFRKPPKDIVESLIDSSPNVAKSKDIKGRNPLHTACYWGASAEVIRTLVDKGGGECLEASDERGSLPLHYACSQGRVSADVIRFLIEAGGPATTKKQDQEGKYPLEYIFTSFNGEELDSILNVILPFPHPFWDENSVRLHDMLRRSPIVLPKQLVSPLALIPLALLLVYMVVSVYDFFLEKR